MTSKTRRLLVNASLLACLVAIVVVGWLAVRSSGPASSADVHVQAPAPAAGSKVESASNDGSGRPFHPAALTVADTTSKRPWELDFFTTRSNAAAGAPIQFELTGGVMAVGIVRHVEHANGELVYVSGELSAPEQGRFFFQKQSMPGKQGEFAGVVELSQSKRAWRVEPGGPNGASELIERRMDEVICLLPPPSAEVLAAEAEEIPPLDPSDVPDYVPVYQDGIVSLQSKPGATAVLYIDYRGGYTPTWGGITYDRPGVSNAQIKDVWKRVAEDYMPFTINVTTDILVYQAAPENSRQRCICTPTTTAAPGAGGVSYLNSWNWTGDTPNWSFYSTGKSAAEVISHECGHALGLSHDGRTSPSEGYYGGQGSGSVGWAPIMGVGYYQSVAQWSKGEYANANNTEDDLGKIVGNNNSVDYRTDDTGATMATARYLEVYADQTVFAEGVVETTGDTDALRFSTNGGNVSLRVDPAPGDWADLAIMLTLADSAGNVVATNNPQSQLWASVSANLPAGSYTLQVTGAGRNDPLTNGFSNYASLGYYSVSGTVTNGVPMTHLSIAENSANGTTVGTVVANNPNNNPLAYSIVSGDAGNVFAIDNNGVLTVANGAPLNYEVLAATTQLTVQYELFVSITNSANPALSEPNRRVAVKVLDVNETPSATGFSTSVYANSQPGTVVGTVTATDPDFYTNVTFSIVGGNPNNAFSIDPASGVVTVSGSLPTAMAGSYVLSVQVSDGGLTATVGCNITVLPGYSGVWANAAGGSWATAANWNGGVVAGGVGETADFSTLNLTANRTVNLDGNRTIGTLLFGDTTPNANWTINPGGGGTLTLSAAGTPVITVNNQTTTIGAVVAGSRGLLKNGTGILTLTGTNTYTGPTSIDAGKLVFKAPANADWTLPSGVVIASGATETIDFTAQTTQYCKTSLGTKVINAGGLLELTGPTNNVNDWYLINSWAASGGGTIRVLNGGIACWTSSNALAGFTGLIDIQGGQFSCNVSGGTTLGGTVDVNVGPGGKLDLRSGNFTMDALTGSGAVIKSWTGDTVTFTIGSNDGSGAWTGSMSGSNYNLVKTGTGTQTLTGTGITYPGTTTVNQGGLMLSGATAFASPVTVNATGTFGGAGSTSAAVTVNNGGMLNPGNNGIGTLSINNALTLSGTVNAEINKTAGTADRVQGVTTLTYGGVLNVVNLSGTLVANDTFALFGATNYSGTFSGINLPALGDGLTWDLSNLSANGSITVINFTGVNPPATAPTGLVATAVSASQIDLTWTAMADATSYGVSRDGIPVAIASGTSFSDTGLNMGTTYSYTVTAINAGGSSAASNSASATTPFVGVTLVWDSNIGTGGAQDGNGTWSNVAQNWLYGASNFGWADGNAASFGVNTVSNCTVTLANDVTPGGITFNATGGGTYTISGSSGIILSGSVPITTNANAALNVVIKGSGALVKNGTGTLSLGAANTYTGTTTISQGTVALNINNLNSTSSYTINDANTGASNTTLQIFGGFTSNRSGLNSIGIRDFSPITITGNGTGTSTLDFNSTTGVWLNGTIAINKAVVLKSTGSGIRAGFVTIGGNGAGAGNDSVIYDATGNTGGSYNWNTCENTGTYAPQPNTYLGNVRFKGGATIIQNKTYANSAYVNMMIPDTASVKVDSGSMVNFAWGSESFNALNDGAGGGGTITSSSSTVPTLTIGVSNGSGAFSGIINSGLGLVKTGSGTQVLGGANTYTGTTSIGGGKLLVNGSLAAGSGVAVNYGGTLAGRGTVNGPVTLSAGATLAAGDASIGTFNLANALTLHDSGTVALRVRKTGATRTADKINLTGPAGVTYKGTLAIAVESGSDPLVVGDKFTLFSKSSGTFAGSFATLDPATPGAGLRWSTANLTVDGSIEVIADTLVQTPEFSAGSGMYAGPLAVGISTTTPGASIRYTTDGSDPKTSGTAVTGPSPAAVSISAPATVTLKAYALKAGLDDSPVVTASYETVAAGTVAWINPAGGSWPVNSNWLDQLVADGAGVTASFDILNLTADATVTLDGARSIGGLKFGDTTPSHNWTLNTGGGGPLTLSVSSGVPAVTVNNQTATLNVVLAGTQGLAKSGAGTLALGGANTYTGTTAISSGTLLVQGPAVTTYAMTSATTTVASGATYKYDFSRGVQSGGFTHTNLKTVAVSSGGTVELYSTLVSGGNGASLLDNGTVISGSGTLNKTGVGEVDFWTTAGALTNFTGPINVQQGTLNFQLPAATDASGQSALNVSQNATADIRTGTLRIDALLGSGTVGCSYNSSNALTIGNKNGGGTFSGIIRNGSATLPVTKNGTGTQIFSGANTYTGLTTITGGTLLINGSQANTATTVAAAGTLGGTGTLAGTVTNNGTLVPGANGIGNLTVNNTLTLAPGSNLVWEIANWTGAAGTGWDKLTVDSLNLTATSANRVTIRPVDLALANFADANATFVLVQTTSGITGFSADKFTVDTAGLTIPHGTWAVQQSGNNLVLAYTAANPDANANGIIDTWETAEFGNAAAGANPSDADPDHDGLSNLMEFALNSDPLAAGTSPLVQTFEPLADGSHLRLTVPKNPAATNLTYIVETCGALNDWSAADTTVESNTASELVVRDNFTTTSAPRRFIRLRVNTQP